MSAKHQVGVMVLDRINALQAGTCGLVGGQTLDDMQAKAVLACIVPPELREHRLLRAFSRLTGCDRDWVRDVAARNGTAAPPPGALGAAVEDGDGDTAQLLAADSPFVDPNGEFEHPHTHHHLPVPPPVLASSPTQLSATFVRGLYMCSCGPDAPHQARCCHRTCSDCKHKCMKLKPGVDGSIMLSVKQYAPVKQKEGPARIELQQFRLSLHEVVDKLNEQMPSYIWHHFVAHHQLAVFQRQQQAVQEKGDHGRVVISCDWSERLSVERPTEIQSDHWHHHNVGIFVACAYFRNDRDEYREETM
ncbi:hypothetical protein QJQ45_007113 [Haematococcus lacustris]|nr:hypothetical protein QJQ45_007113 [Haematococcus lacustris]